MDPNLLQGYLYRLFFHDNVWTEFNTYCHFHGDSRKLFGRPLQLFGLRLLVLGFQ